MRRFRVICFQAGVWDKMKPREIEAKDEREAAERVCGGPLVEAGKPGQLRAQVSPSSKPSEKKMFYVPPQPISN